MHRANNMAAAEHDRGPGHLVKELLRPGHTGEDGVAEAVQVAKEGDPLVCRGRRACC
jgi:hypothetical protein